MSTTDVRDDQLPRGTGGAKESTPIPAASVLLLRETPLEVLMIQRHERSSFVPGAWVFPGGAVEESDRLLGDGTELGTMRMAAVRELFEETAIWLGSPLPDAVTARRDLLEGRRAFADLLRESPIDLPQLIWTARWITPAGVPKRFDTYFFLAVAPDAFTAAVDEGEAVDLRWITPDQAIASLQMLFPTLKNLEAIRGFESAAALLQSRQAADIPTTRPILVIDGNQKRIVLPD